MVLHNSLGASTFARSKALLLLIINDKITLAGNRKGMIYGKLTCYSGKRMKPENRVFFSDEPEAVKAGYRPCAHCLPVEYKIWKTNRSIKQT